MATTRIIPLHTGKGRTVGKAISDIIGYVKNPEKTDHGRLITSYQCDSRVADAQFLLDKQTYAARTGRVRGADDVIAYHLRQSFVPGEITPEEANRLGVELARRFTKDKHAFIVCTHIDKAHVHNHSMAPQVFVWQYPDVFNSFSFCVCCYENKRICRPDDWLCRDCHGKCRTFKSRMGSVVSVDSHLFLGAG